MRTVNEIALETKVTELEKELKSLKQFEYEVCMSCAKLMMTTMFAGEGNRDSMLKLALPEFNNLLGIVQKQMEKIAGK
jgi:hypothetical protein